MVKHNTIHSTDSKNQLEKPLSSFFKKYKLKYDPTYNYYIDGSFKLPEINAWQTIKSVAGCRVYGPPHLSIHIIRRLSGFEGILRVELLGILTVLEYTIDLKDLVCIFILYKYTYTTQDNIQ